MKIFAAMMVVLVAAPPVSAYEVKTHQTLSSLALMQSIVSQKLADFGIIDVTTRVFDLSDTNVTDGTFVECIPNSAILRVSVEELVRLGALCEDAAVGTAENLRFLNHFYDPQNQGQGLYLLTSHTDSLTWALDRQNALTTQQYSIRRAKEYLLAALTQPNFQSRQQNLATMFRTLGHIMHLVQDLGQPQHTRNDSHGFVHRFETYVDRENSKDTLIYGPYRPVTPTKIDDLWHTSTFSGLADYSSRGFVTAGTNFRGILGVSGIQADPSHPLPDPAGALTVARQITDPDLLGPYGPSQALRGEIRFVSTVVADNYAGSADRNPMTATYSLFADDLQHYVGYTHFSLNSLTYREAAKRLIPRAVGYSAGFLNYFFRGSMKVAPPDEGAFAIVNHRPGDSQPAGCGTPCGFRKLKLKVSNTTPDEQMGAGTLLLVARYHLNNCYLSDLSGEFGGTSYAGSICRSVEESISVSNSITVKEVKSDFGDASLEFTFAQPIPINATDLHLQIIFRGVLGEEGDAVAFSSADIYEPTFLIFSNDNDYVSVYNADGSFLRVDPYQPLPGRFSVRVELRFNQSASLPIATTAQLDPGYYHRLAILTDQEFLPYWIREQYVGAQPDTQEFALAASENQTSADDEAFNFPPYVALRRTTPSSWAYESDEDGGAVYWMPGILCADGSLRCIPEDRGVGAYVRRYPPFKQSAPLPMDIAF